MAFPLAASAPDPASSQPPPPPVGIAPALVAEASPALEVEAAPAPPSATAVAATPPRILHAWVATEGGVAQRRTLAPAGTGAAAVGVALDGRLRIGLRAVIATPRDLLGSDARLAERRLGLLAAFSPSAPRIAPDLGITLDNAWRRYSRGDDPGVEHTIFFVGLSAGVALRDGPWSLGSALRLEADLDRTLLRFEGEEEDLPRIQVGTAFAVSWRSGKKSDPGGVAAALSRAMTSPETDPALVEAARTGDPEARPRLIAAWAPVVLGWCTWLAGPGVDSEDAAHDALLAAIGGLSRLREPAAFPPWLFSARGSARNPR